jgi:hypothetical protein
MEKLKLPKSFEYRAYTKKELRTLYGLKIKTFKAWMRSVPETACTGRRNYLNINEVMAFINAHGTPLPRTTKQITNQSKQTTHELSAA